MELLESLIQISKLLLSEHQDKTPELLLRRVLEATGAERGFIVVRDGEEYVQRFHVGFEPAGVSSQERTFSRTLVRQAIQTGELIYSPDVSSDPRFEGMESAGWLGGSAILAVPLRHGEAIDGVVYLEHRGEPDLFGKETRRFLKEFTELAGLFLHRALEHEALRQRNRELQRDLFSRHEFAGILTRDPRMLELLQTVAQVADSDATILVRGETGTGKELIARALHANSRRRSRAFVTVHCTALPSTILESELFGHARCAFTDAQRDRTGRIASAAGGTLFLDEVAEIPLELQSKLLRFLQFGEIQRLGSDRLEKVDVRIVAATHQDLGRPVQEGKFRKDLYFRLNVVELGLPPLRERRGDIPLLLQAFTRRYWRRPGEPPRWSAEAQRALEAYEYPGNVRELENLVERACLLVRGPVLDREMLPEALREARAFHQAEFVELTREELQQSCKAATEAVERRFLAALMDKWSWNVTQAARSSGLNRTHLHKLLRQHQDGLPRPADGSA
jgi:Nif-specific regulatory protein/two-component system response regulator HydG